MFNCLNYVLCTISACSNGKKGLNRRLTSGSKKVNYMNTALKELSFH